MDPDSLSSSEIDDAVRTFSAQGEPVYKLEDEQLLELKPDLLIAQDHCRVCAVTKSDIQENRACHQIPQLIVKPSTLDDCLGDVLKVADALGYPERGERLYKTLKTRMSRAKELGSSFRDSNNAIQPQVALLEWCDPAMGCGYWLPELVNIAGGTPLFSSPAGGATPTISFDSLVEAKPDVIVLALCGFTIARTAKEIGQVWNKEQINQLRQTCNDEIYITDGNFLFNRSGPRVVESAEVLLEAIHRPMRGHFGHFGTKFLMTLQDALDLGDAELASSKIRPPVREGDKLSRQILSTAKPVGPASEMVAKQLACLRLNDLHNAFAYNSAANQRRWCDAAQFISVLKSHNDFKDILHEVPTLEEVATPSNGVVNAKLENGRTLVWTCVVENHKEKGSVWRTERVQ